MRRTRTIGTGITRRTETFTDLATPEEWTHFREGLLGMFDWDSRTKQLLAWVRVRLAEVAHDRPEGGWRKYEDLGWYLDYIETADRIVRDHISKGNANAAAVEGMRLGSAFSEMALKFGWESDALRGLASIEGARRGGHAPRERSERVSSKQEIARAAFRQSMQSRGDPAIAAQRAAAASGYTVRHVRRITRDIK